MRKDYSSSLDKGFEHRILRRKLFLTLLANGFVGDDMPHGSGDDDITKTIFTDEPLKQSEVTTVGAAHSGVRDIIHVYETA
jgi:hypothetical protein